MYKEIAKNRFRTWFLMTAFFIFLIIFGLALSFVFEKPAILYIAVLIAVFQSWLSYAYGDKIILAVSHAKGPLKRSENFTLYNAVQNLSITAGLAMPKVYIIDSPAPNAFATGRDPQHSSIAVTSGLLEKLNKTELEGVISHELSHIGNRDILLSTVVVTLVGLIAIASDWFLRSLWWGGGDRRKGGALALIGIVLILLSPLIATLIQLAISRKREFLSDATGALLTRYPEGLASALVKIAGDRHKLVTATSATAHLYIVNPFKSSLFSTHPPIEERVKRLRAMLTE